MKSEKTENMRQTESHEIGEREGVTLKGGIRNPR